MGVKGFTRDQYGIRAYVKVGTEQREKRFPADTGLTKIRDWRSDTRAQLKKAQGEDAPTGSLGEAITKYLLLVLAMPTYAQRERHLRLWEQALGTSTPLASITAADIRAVLQKWRQAHAAATCNKRRTALMHLFSVLRGKGASNPVRDARKFRAADPLPRGRDPHVIDAALLKRQRGRMRACCRVLLWSGMRPAELQAAQPEDLSLEQKFIIVRTVKGGRTRTVPLTSQGVSAWKEFDRVDCWQDVPQAAPMNRWLKRVTGIEDLRVYDLRHSYGTALARRQTRLDVIGSLMGHSTLELTKRYTLAAVTPDALAATGRLARRAENRKAGKKAGSRKSRRKHGRKVA